MRCYMEAGDYIVTHEPAFRSFSSNYAPHHGRLEPHAYLDKETQVLATLIPFDLCGRCGYLDRDGFCGSSLWFVCRPSTSCRVGAADVLWRYVDRPGARVMSGADCQVAICAAEDTSLRY